VQVETSCAMATSPSDPSPPQLETSRSRYQESALEMAIIHNFTTPHFQEVYVLNLSESLRGGRRFPQVLGHGRRKYLLITDAGQRGLFSVA
jgi:hypothetical protein